MADPYRDQVNGGIKAEKPQPKDYDRIGGGGDEKRASPMERIRVRMAADGYNALNNNNSPPFGTDTETEDEYHPYGSRDAGQYKEQWTRTERKLCIVVIICGIVIILLAVLVFLFHYQMEIESKSKTCNTAECVIVAGTMMGKMDLTVNPCQDFYQYACGQHIKSPLIPPDKSKWGVFQEVKQSINGILKRALDEPGSEYLGTDSTAIEKTKIYYNACMNTTATDELGNLPMQKLIKTLGSWPLISDEVMGTWEEDTWDMEISLARADFLGGGGLFSVGVDTDNADNNMHIITFDQGGLTLANYRSYLGNQSERYHPIFVEYMEGITMLLGASKADSEKAAEELWHFEKKLAEFYVPPEDRQDVKALYNKMTLQQMQDRYLGDFNMSRHLRELFSEDIPMSEEVVVQAPTFFEKMIRLMEKTPKKVLANYIVWQTVSGMTSYMPQPYKVVASQVDRKILGVTSSAPRWEVCVSRTEDVLKFAVGAIYVDKAFPEEAKEQIDKFVKYLFAAFEDALPGVSWMDEVTVRRALNKAKAINTKLAYPDFIKNPAKLDQYYDQLYLTENEQFNNKLASIMYEASRILAMRGKPSDKTAWSMGPSEVNAYYSANKNEIVFPAAILQNPFYDLQYPMAVNYGSIGSVIGHELTHGFDSTGSEFDKYGNMVNWWTNSSRQKYQQRTQCLVDQYNGYVVGDSHVNGITTLDENIADNGGLRTAYNAYIQWLKDHSYTDPRVHLPGLDMTEKQLFFLGFAQTWCTYYTPEYAVESLVTDVHTNAKYRVIGSLSNFDKFTDAFSCKTGAMNPRTKCTVW